MHSYMYVYAADISASVCIIQAKSPSVNFSYTSVVKLRVTSCELLLRAGSFDYIFRWGMKYRILLKLTTYMMYP